MVLFPHAFKASRSLIKNIRNKNYFVTADEDFEGVIRSCATVSRKYQEEPGYDDGKTWITDGIIEAYLELHRLGFAHSIETWWNNELVGGLYGVSIGRVFFGESLFFRKTDASKVALYHLATTSRQVEIHNDRLPTDIRFVVESWRLRGSSSRFSIPPTQKYRCT